MALRSLIKPKAEANFFAAAQWYQEQEPDSNLALGLFEEFDTVLELICERPDAFPEYDGAVRRAVLRRFPYAIEPGRVVVLTFLAMAQERGPGHSR